MNADDDYEAELIAQAQAGDTAALTALLVEYRLRLVELLERRLPRRRPAVVDVEDLVQQAHFEVFCHIGTLVPSGPGTFHRWVSTIALRKLRDAARRQRAAKRGGGTAALNGAQGLEDSVIALLDLIQHPGRTPSRVVAGREAAAAVDSALSRLPADYAQAVRLVYLQGCSAGEAARAMGRTDRAIHNLCYKARDRLRELLGSESRFFTDTG